MIDTDADTDPDVNTTSNGADKYEMVDNNALGFNENGPAIPANAAGGKTPHSQMYG